MVQLRDRLILACAVAVLLSVPTASTANGEPSAGVVNSGILIPITDARISVLDQRIDIVLPKPPRADDNEESAADIKVRYELENRQTSPVRVTVAWPSGGLSWNIYQQDRPEYPVSISLDRKPLTYKFLRRGDLAEPYVAGWLKRIDTLLRSKPKLKAKVLEMRKSVPRQPKGPHQDFYLSQCQQLAGRLGQWMADNDYLSKKVQHKEGNCITAAGLLGMPLQGAGRDRLVQSALKWLDPKHSRIDLDEVLAERWGYATLLLDPNTHWLVDLKGPMLYPVEFAVIKFDLTLKPKTKHILNVSYRQSLGGVGRPPDWYGMAYFMEPARRWGGWRKTTINITAPNGWKKVVVRPTPSSAAKTKQKRVLTIAMPGRPYEDLYISLVPP